MNNTLIILSIILFLIIIVYSTSKFGETESTTNNDSEQGSIGKDIDESNDFTKDSYNDSVEDAMDESNDFTKGSSGDNSGTNPDADNISYNDITSTQTVIVYAPWCGHCKRSMTEFKKAVSNSNGKVVMVSSDNKDSKQILKELKGKGYPHIAKGLHTSYPIEYKGDRTADKIIKFANS